MDLELCLLKNKNNLSLIISCSRKETDSSKLVESIGTGQIIEVFITMMIKHSSSGLMRKIN